MADGKLDVVVVGAGVAGLACAVALARHEKVEVTVLDKATGIQQGGHGLHLPPNASQALRGLNLLEKVEAVGVEGEAISMLAGLTGMVDLYKNLAQCRGKYGAPWLFVHHDDLMGVLIEEAQALGVEIEWNSAVEDVDFEAPSVQVEGGRVVSADIVIGADGVHSKTRGLMYPDIDVQANKLVSYWGKISHEVVKDDSELGKPAVARVWLGPRASVEMIPVQSGREHHLRFTLDGDLEGDDESEVLGERLLKRFNSWNPRVLAMISKQAELRVDLKREEQVDVMDLPDFNRGKVTLIGDAAHPMDPFLYQDTALAIEDGIILGTLLGLSPRGMDIPAVLDAYARLQHARANTLARHSSVQRRWNHFDDDAMVAMRMAEFEEAAAAPNWDMVDSDCPWANGLLSMGVWKRDAERAARAELLDMTRPAEAA